MASLLDLQRLRKMTVEDRLTMMQQIWETIIDDEDCSELTPAFKDELRRRLADLEAHPEDGITWEELEASLRAKRAAARSSSAPPREGKSKKRTTTTRSSGRV